MVLTILLSAMLAALAVAIRGDHQAAFVTLGTALAKAKLAAAGVDYPLQPGAASGTFDNGYLWRAEVRRHGMIASGGERPIIGYRVEVTVSDPRANGGRTVSLVSVEIEQGSRP
jgi:hypothetical protein